MSADGSEQSLVALAERYALTTAQCGMLEALLEVLARDGHAPTSPRALESALETHVCDSLCALDFTEMRHARSIADLGSGAGFPGLPLAVALPEAKVSLVESQARKCAFISRAASATGLSNVDVILDRAETWRAGVGTQDVTLARALAPPAVVLEYAAPLLRAGGFLVDWRGGREPGEERSAALAGAELGLQLVEIRRMEPFAGARDHHLHLYEKVRDTPERFPRRPGIARKRPLGA
jgi:16S rRNA (guanine527-N7)-methyltransferase